MDSLRRNTPLARALVVAVGYVVVGAAVFITPTRSMPPPDMEARIAAGNAVWRENNCVACHSLYGLGGHLGPDLTNVIKWRGAPYVQAMVTAGRPGMPSFSALSPTAMTNLLAYLTFVNETGEYPPRTRPLRAFGRLHE